MITLPIFNRKGGVSKTATTINTSGGLARRGKRVLVIDWDPQANATTHIGRPDHPKGAPTVAHVFLQPSLTEAAIAPSVVDGVDLLYGSNDLAEAEQQVIARGHSAPGHILTRILKRVPADRYDYVLIDCTNQSGQLARNAVIAAERILVPIQTEYSGMEGLGLVRKLIDTLLEEEAIEKSPELLVFAAMVDERIGTARALRTQVGSLDDCRPLHTIIHRCAPISDCYGWRKTIFDYDPRSRGAAEFAQLSEEIDTLFTGVRAPKEAMAHG